MGGVVEILIYVRVRFGFSGVNPVGSALSHGCLRRSLRGMLIRRRERAISSRHLSLDGFLIRFSLSWAYPGRDAVDAAVWINMNGLLPSWWDLWIIYQRPNWFDLYLIGYFQCVPHCLLRYTIIPNYKTFWSLCVYWIIGANSEFKSMIYLKNNRIGLLLVFLLNEL